MSTYVSDTALLAQYVAAFGILDDLCALRIPPALQTRAEDEYTLGCWEPRPITTPPSALKALYLGLSLPGVGAARFPPLYETLLLSYRWAEADLKDYRLLANEPAADLSPLLSTMQSDKSLYATLAPNGYFQFGRGSEQDYDPLCFDFRHRQKNGDCRIVRLDHEAILCYGRIRETAELAPNFRTLVQNTIRAAALQQDRSSG